MRLAIFHSEARDAARIRKDPFVRKAEQVLASPLPDDLQLSPQAQAHARVQQVVTVASEAAAREDHAAALFLLGRAQEIAGDCPTTATALAIHDGARNRGDRAHLQAYAAIADAALALADAGVASSSDATKVLDRAMRVNQPEVLQRSLDRAVKDLAGRRDATALDDALGLAPTIAKLHDEALLNRVLGNARDRITTTDQGLRVARTARELGAADLAGEAFHRASKVVSGYDDALTVARYGLEVGHPEADGAFAGALRQAPGFQEAVDLATLAGDAHPRLVSEAVETALGHAETASQALELAQLAGAGHPQLQGRALEAAVARTGTVDEALAVAEAAKAAGRPELGDAAFARDLVPLPADSAEQAAERAFDAGYPEGARRILVAALGEGPARAHLAAREARTSFRGVLETAEQLAAGGQHQLAAQTYLNAAKAGDAVQAAQVGHLAYGRYQRTAAGPDQYYLATASQAYQVATGKAAAAALAERIARSAGEDHLAEQGAAAYRRAIDLASTAAERARLASDAYGWYQRTAAGPDQHYLQAGAAGFRKALEAASTPAEAEHVAAAAAGATYHDLGGEAFRRAIDLASSVPERVRLAGVAQSWYQRTAAGPDAHYRAAADHGFRQALAEIKTSADAASVGTAAAAAGRHEVGGQAFRRAAELASGPVAQAQSAEQAYAKYQTVQAGPDRYYLDAAAHGYDLALGGLRDVAQAEAVAASAGSHGFPQQGARAFRLGADLATDPLVATRLGQEAKAWYQRTQRGPDAYFDQASTYAYQRAADLAASPPARPAGPVEGGSVPVDAHPVGTVHAEGEPAAGADPAARGDARTLAWILGFGLTGAAAALVATHPEEAKRVAAKAMQAGRDVKANVEAWASSRSQGAELDPDVAAPVAVA